MRLLLASGLLAATSAQAFSDSSPFVLFSTSELPVEPNTPQLQSTSSLLPTVRSLLSKCPTSHYLLVSQPNLNAADLRAAGSSLDTRAPNLYRALQHDDVKGRFSVAEVMGALAGSDLADYIKAACLAEGKGGVVVEEKRLRALEGDSEARSNRLSENDHELSTHLTTLRTSSPSYTVLYFSDPHSHAPYEPSFADPIRSELKRRQDEQASPPGHSRRASARAGEPSDTPRDNRPLFEKYQFFTPGIFMALVSLVVLMSILYVGLSALASLEVSYGAFSKEMGPAAQKKNM